MRLHYKRMIITLQPGYSISPLRQKRTWIKIHLIAWRYIYTKILSRSPAMELQTVRWNPATILDFKKTALLDLFDECVPSTTVNRLQTVRLSKKFLSFNITVYIVSCIVKPAERESNLLLDSSKSLKTMLQCDIYHTFLTP